MSDYFLKEERQIHDIYNHLQVEFSELYPHLYFSDLLWGNIKAHLEYWLDDWEFDFWLTVEEDNSVSTFIFEQGCDLEVRWYDNSVYFIAKHEDVRDSSDWSNWEVWAQGEDVKESFLDCYHSARRVSG